MKKQILLSMLFCFAATSLFAADLIVTSPSGDATVEGSFPNIMATAVTNDVIKFNLSSDEIGEFTAIIVEGKSLTIDGLNAATGNKIIFTGAKQALSMKGGGTILIKNCVFTGKKTQTMFVQTAVNLNLLDCEFINNSHTSSGGVMGISQDVICNIKNCLFDGNQSIGGDGACLRIYNNARVTIENSTFINNKSSSNGGVIYLYSTNGKNETALALNIINSTFVNNSSAGRAGAIYIYSRDTSKPVDNIKIVNSTITANYAAKNLGGGIFLCSNIDCTTKLTVVNSIIVGNTGGLVDGAYFVPTDIGCWAGDGKVRNYDWEAKNNIVGKVYATGDDTQLNNTDSTALFDASNIKVSNFATSNIFTSLYLLDNTVFPDIEGDEVWSPELTTGDMPVAALCENSIAIGKGIATHADVTVPTVDQLGMTRPATPAIGAVEYSTGTGIALKRAIGNDILIWCDSNNLFVDGADANAVVVVFDLTGKQVYKGLVSQGTISLNIEKGVYIAKVNNKTAKLMIK